MQVPDEVNAPDEVKAPAEVKAPQQSKSRLNQRALDIFLRDNRPRLKKEAEDKKGVELKRLLPSLSCKGRRHERTSSTTLKGELCRYRQ